VVEQKIHEFQLLILRELLFKPGARFRDLNKSGVTNDHFSFHINRLLDEALITKTSGKYYLTVKGKEFANRMDTEKLEIEKQAKVAIALFAIRGSGKKKEYLIHKRLKEPFYGWYGSHSGKVRWGETPLQAAIREFKEETGLSGNFIHKGIVHYHHFYKDGKLLEDKYFWVYRVEYVKGRLKRKVPEGENIWMMEEKIRKIENIFATFDEMTEVLESKHLVYIERPRFVSEY